MSKFRSSVTCDLGPNKSHLYAHYTPLFPSVHGCLYLREQWEWWLLYCIRPSDDGVVSQSSFHSLFCHKARIRRELPHDLDLVMEDARRKGEEVEEVSIGVDGDWFLRTNARHGTLPPTPEPASPSIPFRPWLKQETTMPQHAKRSTLART